MRARDGGASPRSEAAERVYDTIKKPLDGEISTEDFLCPAASENFVRQDVFCLYCRRVWYTIENVQENGLQKPSWKGEIEYERVLYHRRRHSAACKADMPEEKEKCPLVIVFHGLTGNMEERHITAVSSAMNEIGFATLRVELYGHGKSGGTFEQHNLMKWINNAMTVTDYAKTLDFVTDLYICGHSQGGLLTMLAAGMRADDFKAAIPMSPAIVIPDGARKGNLLGQPFDPEHIPDMVEWGDRHLSGNYLRTAQLLDVDEAIRKYEKPVLLIHGDADEAVPIEYSIDAAKKYKNAKLVQIPGDTHCYDEHLDQVTAAVKKFLGEMENREG